MSSKARVITLDIETYRTRNPQIIDRLVLAAIEKRPANNTLKELKLEWDTEKARTERAREAIEKTSVDVLLAEPLLVCWRVRFPGSSEWVDEYTSFMRTDEQLAYGLPELAESLGKVAGPDTIWAGHNIAGFDLPVLLNQWRLHKVKPPEHFPRYTGRWMGRVFDTMLRTPTKTPYLKLEEACEAYGLQEFPTIVWDGQAMDGSRVGAAFEAGAFRHIIEYCQADVHMEDALYQAMTIGDTWGTYDDRSEIAEQVTAIEKSVDLTAAQKSIAIVSLLDRAGLIPRAA